ncbi:MAG: 30S ribosomal protein S8 [Candidatus Omnitrophota bacterium]|nr:MAG: 30S ribosomal protein S8 [Candidatus Omnitrophota bacterium]
MPVTDPIADMLAVLRNGVMAHKDDVLVKRSKINESILEILKREGFISNCKTVDDKKQGILKVYLKYGKNNETALTGLKKISKPGLRIYVKSKEIKDVYGGIGIALISTPQGIMTDKEAKKENLGGEIICEVW